MEFNEYQKPIDLETIKLCFDYANPLVKTGEFNLKYSENSQSEITWSVEDDSILNWNIILNSEKWKIENDIVTPIGDEWFVLWEIEYKGMSYIRLNIITESNWKDRNFRKSAVVSEFNETFELLELNDN